MKNYLIIITLFACTGLSTRGQYIDTIFEYLPAPGQYINTAWGSPYSTSSLVGGAGGGLSLGAFGGYVVFAFDEPVENDPGNPYGVDFTIFGNPTPDWSEPGIVSVMRDDNMNGLPDDTWYTLAGSDHFFSGTITGYSVTYRNPESDEAADVSWSDNLGNTGVIPANAFHTQPYFPLIDSFNLGDGSSLTLSGTGLQINPDFSNPVRIATGIKDFGYADNRIRKGDPGGLPDNPYTREVEHSGGDAFDISWAVDEGGGYVELEEIHFVKVQSAAIADAGPLGEISTEIAGAIDVAAGSAPSGTMEMLVLASLPDTIYNDTLQLEVAYFVNGRKQALPPLTWDCNHEAVHVDDELRLIMDLTASPGLASEIKVTAHLAEDGDIADSACAFADLSATPVFTREAGPRISIYPNPASDRIHVEATPGYLLAGDSGVRVTLVDLSGRPVRNVWLRPENSELDISSLKQGCYILRCETLMGVAATTFIRQ